MWINRAQAALARAANALTGSTAAAGVVDASWPFSAFAGHYTWDLTLFTLGDSISVGDRALLERDGIAIVDEALAEVCTGKGAIVGLITRSGKTFFFDTLYSALGCNTRSELPRLLGTAFDERGQVIVDDHLRTSIPDVYAAGDIANDLNQIAVAAGHAAIAATAIHNSLRER